MRIQGVTQRAWVGGALGAGVGLVGLSRLTSLRLPPCPTYALAGIECPGCGAARCVGALLEGDLIGAFGFHPLLPIFLVLIAASVVVPSRAVGAALNRRYSAQITAIAVITLWIIRLIPIPAFDPLRAN
jgi:hypothetical protein